MNAEKQKISLKEQRNLERERQAKKEKKQRKVYEGLPTITQGKGETRVKKKKRKETKKCSKQQH